MHAGKKVIVTVPGIPSFHVEGYLVLNTGGHYPYYYQPWPEPRLRVTDKLTDLLYPILPIWPGDRIAVVK